MYRYNQKDFDPPAPEHFATILTPTNSVFRHQAVIKDVSMILDTGGDFSCVPSYVIRDMENFLGSELPYATLDINSFDGTADNYKVYELLIESDWFPGRQKVNLVSIPISVGILGREILNNHILTLDGPGLLWHYR